MTKLGIRSLRAARVADLDPVSTRLGRCGCVRTNSLSWRARAASPISFLGKPLPKLEPIASKTAPSLSRMASVSPYPRAVRVTSCPASSNRRASGSKYRVCGGLSMSTQTLKSRQRLPKVRTGADSGPRTCMRTTSACTGFERRADGAPGKRSGRPGIACSQSPSRRPK